MPGFAAAATFAPTTSETKASLSTRVLHVAGVGALANIQLLRLIFCKSHMKMNYSNLNCST
jgi:hypothetical protein